MRGLPASVITRLSCNVADEVLHLLSGKMRDAAFEVRDYVDFPASARSERLGHSMLASTYEIDMNRLGFLYAENKDLF